MSMNNYQPAGLLRRLGALLYDSIILLALSFVLAMCAIIANGGESIPPNNVLFQTLLVISWLIFYCYFFTQGGQTIGMRAWKIRLLRSDGQNLTLKDALIRCMLGALGCIFLGLGYLWILVDGQRRALHDIASNTQVLFIINKQK